VNHSSLSATTRRRFMLATIGAGGAIAVGGIDFFGVRTRDLQHHTHAARALGTDVSITVAHTNAGRAAAAVRAAFAELETVERLMSIYRADSQLSQLNRDGSLSEPHPYLVEVLQFASMMAAKTHGAFDVTVQPLWQLFRECRHAERLPTADEITAARSLVDWRCVEIQPRQIRLQTPARAITLNGIAQGFAADRVLAILREHGIQHALVNAGEIATLGGRTGQEPWRAGIQHPRDPEAYLSIAGLTDRCLATSGDYATPFSDDFQHHHLFDPRTGCSPAELASVSVAAPTSMLADALSTALLVLGRERGWELVASMPEVDAMWVSKDGRVCSTAEFPADV
jgi:thiamine biosynthesis lipoprotein